MIYLMKKSHDRDTHTHECWWLEHRISRSL